MLRLLRRRSGQSFCTVGQHLTRGLHLLILLMEAAIQQIQDSLESFQSVQQDILERLESIEKGASKSDSSAGSNKSGDNKSRFGSAHNGAKSLHQAIGNHSPANICTAAINSQADPLARVDNSVQDEYKGIKDKVANVKIPQELRCGTSKAGIKREDSNSANIISNCAKYVETTIKLLWNLDEEPTREDLIEVF